MEKYFELLNTILVVAIILMISLIIFVWFLMIHLHNRFIYKIDPSSFEDDHYEEDRKGRRFF